MKNIFAFLLILQVLARPNESKLNMSNIINENFEEISKVTFQKTSEFLGGFLPNLAKRLDKNQFHPIEYWEEKKIEKQTFCFARDFLQERRKIIKECNDEIDKICLMHVKFLTQSLNGKTLVLPSPSSSYKSFQITFALLATNPEIKMQMFHNAYSKLAIQCARTREKNPKNKFAQLPSIALRLIHEFVPEYDDYEMKINHALYEFREDGKIKKEEIQPILHKLFHQYCYNNCAQHVQDQKELLYFDENYTDVDKINFGDIINRCFYTMDRAKSNDETRIYNGNDIEPVKPYSFFLIKNSSNTDYHFKKTKAFMNSSFAKGIELGVFYFLSVTTADSYTTTIYFRMIKELEKLAIQYNKPKKL